MATVEVQYEAPPAHEPTEGPGKKRLGVVFWVPVAFTLAFVLAGVFATETLNSALSAAVEQVVEKLGWLYLLAVTGFLVFAVFLAFSRFGAIRLGGPDEKPEFSTFSWFAMLFQAGMGIGIVFWAIGEPLNHVREPPFGLAAPGSPQASELAIVYSFFHWTLHPWGVYAVIGLAIAYFGYRRGVENLRISSVFTPLLGDRVNGPIGKAIDVVAVVAVLFGIAVSLGSGTLQIEASLGTAYGFPRGVGVQMAIIAVTVVAYLLSASTPIDRGIRLLSNASIVLAGLLLAFVFVVGPSIGSLNAFTQGIGQYAATVIPTSVRMSPFQENGFLGEWTIFFWATWIAWAPYVGVFIARISRGRTIREFVGGVLLAPSLVTMLWFAVFGAAGIEADSRAGGSIGQLASEDEAAAMFAFLQTHPLFLLTAGLTMFLVWIFFVAGADAGTIVLGSLSSGGERDPTRRGKLTWGVLMGAVAGALLLAGGLDALQNGAILFAVPFGVLMVLIAWCLFRALSADHREERVDVDQLVAQGTETVRHRG